MWSKRLQGDYAPPGCGLYKVHDALSDVTERRKKCMPFEGTLDFPVLLFITLLNLFTFVYGVIKIGQDGEIVSLRGSEQQNVKMIALVFALVEATPGVLFTWCALEVNGCVLVVAARGRASQNMQRCCRQTARRAHNSSMCNHGHNCCNEPSAATHSGNSDDGLGPRSRRCALCRYMASYRCCRFTLWVWVPLVITLVAILVTFIELRVGIQYVTTALGVNWQLPDCTLNSCPVFSAGKS